MLFAVPQNPWSLRVRLNLGFDINVLILNFLAERRGPHIFNCKILFRVRDPIL